MEPMSTHLNTFSSGPDENGHFGNFGGRFVAETLMPLILDVEKPILRPETIQPSKMSSSITNSITSAGQARCSWRLVSPPILAVQSCISNAMS